MTIHEIMSIIRTARETFPEIAIRGTASEYLADLTVGSILPESYDWDADRDCSTYDTDSTTLGGTCGIQLPVDNWACRDYDDDAYDQLTKVIAYMSLYGDKLILVGGYNATQGADWASAVSSAEIIVENATYVADIA